MINLSGKVPLARSAGVAYPLDLLIPLLSVCPRYGDHRHTAGSATPPYAERSPDDRDPRLVTTPVRRHQPDPDGISLLRETGSSYLDGGEERVLEVLRACRDLSSLSDERLSYA